MRMLLSLHYHAVCSIFEYLFIQGTMSLALGLFESISEPQCEYEDANLIWQNKPAYSLNDVKAMEWYNGNGSRMAIWEDGKGFKEYPPYIGRLMQIGETGLKLKTANRSDSSSYWLYLILASVNQTLKAVTHFEVIVAPSSQCKPTITEEGSILKAKVPFDGCGTSPLSPKWKNISKTVIQQLQNQSLLDLGRNFQSGEYIVCAEGDSVKCYKGNISDLCTGLTKLQHGRHEDGFTPDPVSIILPIVLVAVIAIIVLIVGVIWWRRKFSPETCAQDEEYPLIEKGLPEIQNYLRGLYKDMTSVSLSPTGKENFVDVSEVYIDLDFELMESSDFKYAETILTRTTSYKASVSKEDSRVVEAHNHHVSPIIIAGCNGCGKTTWCKYIVHCWSQNFKTEDANVHGINLPSLGEYQVLLYLPLKSSDRGVPFQKLLKQILFQGQPEYLNIITKYMHDKSHARSILILIDGFDKIVENGKPMSEFLDHKLLSLCTVICTCRPSSLNLIYNACVDSSIQLGLFKVCEFTLEKSTAYAIKVLSRLSQHNRDINIKNFLIFTRNLHLQSLLELPYLCLMLLFIWMENKNPYIEITDILLRIMEHLLDSAKTDQQCNKKIMTLTQGNSPEVHTSVKKLDERFAKIKELMYELSTTTEEIFLLETKGLTDEERLARETKARGKDALPLEVMHEIGLITTSQPLKSTESLSTLTFTNVLIYHLFVSMAIAFKKGHAFKYIVSDTEVALENSMIIHMLWQFSPTLGKEMFIEMRKLKTKKLEKHGLSKPEKSEKLVLSKQNNKFRYSITKQSKKSKYHEVNWLQSLMYKGDLDDEKLLFLTNAIRSLDSLTSLVLENNENNADVVFWLPCSQNLEKLALNINNCTLLLCPEWNNQIPLKLKEVVIKNVIISRCDFEILCKAFMLCEKIEKQEMAPTVVSTGDCS